MTLDLKADGRISLGQGKAKPIGYTATLCNLSEFGFA